MTKVGTKKPSKIHQIVDTSTTKPFQANQMFAGRARSQP